MMTPKEQEGYELAEGVFKCLAKNVLIVAAIILILSFMRNVYRLGMDDSDTSAWSRSGLQVHTDAKTGIQYLSDGKGGLVRRQTE